MMSEIATPENVKIGTAVKKNGNIYYAYKVNKLFVWAGKVTPKAVIDGWKQKPKDETWIKYMEKMNAEKLTFKGMSIESNEAVIEVRKVGKKGTTKSLLKSCCEKEIDTMFKRYAKGKSILGNNFCKDCSEILRGLSVGEDGRMLIGNNYRAFYYDPSTKIYEMYRNYSGDSEPVKEEVIAKDNIVVSEEVVEQE